MARAEAKTMRPRSSQAATHIILAFLGILVLAGPTAGQATSSLPAKITGYAGYRFGMTLEEARRADKDAVETACNYVGHALCLEKEATFFGERARVDALFG